MKGKLNILTKAAILLAIAMVFQLVKLGQFFTGAGINTVLIIAASVCGPLWAAAIGTLTPFLALALGVQPPAMLPVLPFIVAGNIVYAVLYWLIQNKNRYLGVAAASLAKFALLYAVVNFLITVKPPIKVALSLPQLVTAVAGGAIALIVLKALEKGNS